MQTRASLVLRRWLNGCKICLILRIFMTRLGSVQSSDWRITKAKIELNGSSGSSGLILDKTRRNNRFEDSAVVFYENDHLDIPSHHNRHLY